MQNQVHKVERARDRAKWKLEVAQSQPGGTGGSGPAQSRSTVYKENTDLVRVDGKVRCEHFYPDGGACTQWFSDLSDNEKENYDPGSSSRSRHPSTSSRHSSSQYDNFSDFSAPFEIGHTVSPLPSETVGSLMAAGMSLLLLAVQTSLIPYSYLPMLVFLLLISAISDFHHTFYSIPTSS
jgi:hypothetical protein